MKRGRTMDRRRVEEIRRYYAELREKYREEDEYKAESSQFCARWNMADYDNLSKESRDHQKNFNY